MKDVITFEKGATLTREQMFSERVAPILDNRDTVSRIFLGVCKAVPF